MAIAKFLATGDLEKGIKNFKSMIWAFGYGVFEVFTNDMKYFHLIWMPFDWQIKISTNYLNFLAQFGIPEWSKESYKIVFF